MRVAILSNKDPTSNLVFEKLCNCDEFKVVGIGFSSTLTAKNTYWAGVMDIFSRTGKRYFWYMCFWNGVFLIKEKIFNVIPSLKGFFGNNFFSLRNYAKSHKVEIIDSNNFNSPAFIRKVKEWNPDIIVTRINQILRKEILELSKYGCWCCHSSLLPDYQGIAAEFYNLLNKERYAGFTIMQMTEELDKGDTLLQEKIEISEEDTVYSLTQKNAKLGGRLLLKALCKLKNGDLLPKKQLRAGKYYSWPDAKAVTRFKANEKKFMKLSEIFQYSLGHD